MPATNQSAVSTLIREVLADPDLAHDEVFRRLPPGRAAGSGRRRGRRRDRRAALRAHPAAHQPPQRHEAQDRGHHRRGGRACDPRAAHGVVLPLPAPPAPAGGAGPGCAVICSARSRGGLHPQGLATWCGPWATSRGSPGPRSRGSARRSTRACTSSCPAAWTAPGSLTCSPGATHLDVRAGHRVVCRALVVATGVSAQGRREIPEHGPGRRRDHRFLDVLVLRSLRERGLKVPSPEDPTGVVLVTSDAHAGIRAAVRAILPGAAWQRCRAPLRPQHHLQARFGPLQARQRAGLDDLRPDQSGGRGGPVQARHRFPEGGLPRDRSDAEGRRAGPNGLRHDPSAPGSTGPRSGRSNPIERLNREIKRRADVVQVFPDSDSVTRLIGSVLLEQHEEWQYGERRYLSQTSLRHLTDMLQADNSTDASTGNRAVLPPITT